MESRDVHKKKYEFCDDNLEPSDSMNILIAFENMYEGHRVFNQFYIRKKKEPESGCIQLISIMEQSS